MKKAYNYIALCIIVISLIGTNLKGNTSIFSSLGFGDLYPSNLYSSGICYNDSNIIKTNNYVNWANINRMQYSISLGFNYYQAETETNSSNFDGFTIEGFNLAVPFGNKNTFGLSLTPYSLVDISSFYSEVAADTSSVFGEITSVSNIKKLGGINNIALVYAKKINNFSFSFDLTGKFGNIKREAQTKITETEELFEIGKLEQSSKTKIENFSIGTSLKYDINEQFSISTLFSLPIFHEITESSSYEYYRYLGGYILINEIKKNSEVIEDTEWPMTIGAGMFFKPNQFSFSSEFLFSNFAGKNIGFYDETEYNDFLKVGLSIGFSNYINKLSPYYKKIQYNLDLAYVQQPYKFNDNEINDLSVNLGIVFPYNDGRSSIKIDGGIVKSGDVSTNTIESLTYKFGLTFNGSGNWALRTKKYDD